MQCTRSRRGIPPLPHHATHATLRSYAVMVAGNSPVGRRAESLKFGMLVAELLRIFGAACKARSYA